MYSITQLYAGVPLSFLSLLHLRRYRRYISNSTRTRPTSDDIRSDQKHGLMDALVDGVVRWTSER